MTCEPEELTMLDALRARLQQGQRTIDFPLGAPTLPDRFRGLPVLSPERCVDGCRECIEACPTGALSAASGLQLDLGRCLFCSDCVDACPTDAVRFTSGYQLSARRREDFLQTGGDPLPGVLALQQQALRLFGRSLRLRQVSAGGCNACEADVAVLNTIVFDLGRFGIQFVASPRHADGLLITGPVTRNMREALRLTYEAIPDPKIVIAVGACAISGGPYIGHPEVGDGADSVVPVDLYVAGCPPHPITILDGLLSLLGRLP
jgi:Ni,Fe-hydrogenase III small subunit/Pyruvate/2-oxoacid:ferredoxin oxidoreductase delta subunit